MTDMRETLATILGEHFGYSTIIDRTAYKAIDEVLDTLRTPDSRMLKAGEAWRNHCSDTDRIYSAMIQAARYPEDYPA